MEKPLVSIILPTYNGAKYIERAVASVQGQTYKNIEIIIVNDGSTDQTAEVIFELRKNDSRIIILTNQANLGYVKSLNVAAKKVAGKYITRIDDDDIFCDQNRLEKQVRFLEKHQDYVLVGGGMIKIDENEKEVSMYLFPEKDEDIRKTILLSHSIAHGTVFFRKDAFEKVGGYDEQFGFFADLALSLSLGKLGKFYNFQEYFSYYFDKELCSNYASRNRDVRRKVRASTELVKKYKNDYPGYTKAYLSCWARYFFSFLPFRKKLLPLLLKIRALFIGPISYKYYKSKKIKICHIASVDMTVKFLLLPQLKFLQQEGYDVHVVCSEGKWKKDIEAEGIKVKNIRIKRRITPFSDFVSFFQLFFYFRKEKFQIIHTHTPKPGLIGQLAGKMAGVPIIVNTIHGFYFSDKTPFFKRNFYTFIEKIAGRCSDLIFSQNREDINTIINKKIASFEKIRYLGNGVDIEKFNSERFSKDFISRKKTELGLNPNFKIIGTVGRLVQEKGYFDLFSAFKKVLEKFPGTLLLIVGPEDLEKGDAFDPKIVKNYGIENNVVFLGERTDVVEIYSLMDIFVLASWREGFPRTVIEAMAMKRPIITTDIRGCKEAIKNNENGILIPPKNSEKLAEALFFMLANPDMAEKMAKNAREKAEKEFDENIVFSKIKEEYQILIDRYIGRISRKIFILKKIKICHVTTVDITVRFILWDLLKFLRKENFDVSIICSPGKWATFLKKGNFFVYNIKMLRRISPFADLIPLIKLFLFFKRQKFDIVHTHTPKAGVLGRIAARLAGVPVIIHSSHGFYTGIKIDPWIKTVILFAEKLSSHFCDMVTFLNGEDVDFAIKKGIVNSKKIKFLTYGIDIKRFDASKFSQDFIYNKKKELGIENKRVIGMVGRFVEEKGYLDLFEAFKTVKDKNPDVALLLVAPPDKVKQDALNYSVLKDYGIEKETTILGKDGEIENIEEIYSLMDIFVLPSYREGFPYSIMEASSSGKPVITTDVRGCREAIENGKTGILVPPENPDKLAQNIIYLLDNPKKSEELGKNGRKRAEKEFDERLFFDRIKEEYERILKKNKL